MTGLIMISQVERVQNESLLWTSSYLGFHILYIFILNIVVELIHVS